MECGLENSVWHNEILDKLLSGVSCVLLRAAHSEKFRLRKVVDADVLKDSGVETS